jgi:hypothetical protein
VTTHARRKRIAELTGLAAGLTLFVTSLGGIASVDRTLSAAAPVPPPALEQSRVVEPFDAGSDCPREHRRDARDV